MAPSMPLGAYFAFEIQRYLGFAGALILSPILVAAIGIVLERTMFRRFYRSDPSLACCSPSAWPW